MSELPENDDALLAQPREAVGHDIVPPGIQQLLQELPSLIRSSDELGRTTYDESSTLSGTRESSGSRHLAIDFSDGSLVLEISPEGRITGQIPEAWGNAHVTVETLQSSVTIETDEFGLFSADAGSGPFRIATHSAGRNAVTKWLIR